MTETRISVKVTPDEKRVWEESAEARGMSFAAYVREALDLLSGLDPYALGILKKISDQHGIGESVVIGNLLIAWAADKDAIRAFWHGPIPWPEFQYPNVDGEILYDQLLCDNLREHAYRKALLDNREKIVQAIEGEENNANLLLAFRGLVRTILEHTRIEDKSDEAAREISEMGIKIGASALYGERRGKDDEK